MGKLLYNDKQYAGTVTPQPEMCPIGKIDMYAGSNAPNGWLLCHGQAISRTVYADLFAVIGTTYGEGDGLTTFNVPDLCDRVPVGAGNSYLLNDNGGTDFETFADAQIAHGHGFTQPKIPNHTHAAAASGYSFLTQKAQSGKSGSLVICAGTGPSDYTMFGVIGASQYSYLSMPGATGNPSSLPSCTEGSVSNLYGASNTRTQHDNRMPYRGVNFIIYYGTTV